MPNNVFAGRANGIISKTGVTVAFSDAGINSTTTYIIYKLGDSLQSYVPGRSINPITQFEEETAYYLIPKIDFDLSAYVNTDDMILSPVTSGDLSLKANIASPAFTGTPTAPTAAAGTNTTQVATTAFAKAEAEDAAQTVIDDNPVYFSADFAGTGAVDDPITVNIIDDSEPLADKTYSSEQIESLIDGFSSGGIELEQVVSREDISGSTAKRFIYASADVINSGLRTLFFHATDKLLMISTSEEDVPVTGPQPLNFTLTGGAEFLDEADGTPPGTGGTPGVWGRQGYGVADQSLAIGVDGHIEAEYVDATNKNTWLGLDTDGTATDPGAAGWAYYIFVDASTGEYTAMRAGYGEFTASGVTATAGDKYRLVRTGTDTISAEYYRSESWHNIKTFVVTEGGELFLKAAALYNSGYTFLINPKGQNIS